MSIMQRKMKIWIHILVFAMSSLPIMSQNCPSEHFSAVFTATIDQTADNPGLSEDDPELMFFKTYMNFRDSDIQHTIEDAIQFFNNTYGLDFSDSVPNEKNEYFIWNITKMSPIILPIHINYIQLLIKIFGFVQEILVHHATIFVTEDSKLLFWPIKCYMAAMVELRASL